MSSDLRIEFCLWLYQQVLIGSLTDERALVEGARQLGFVFSVRTPQDVTVSTVNTFYVILCQHEREFLMP